MIKLRSKTMLLQDGRSITLPRRDFYISSYVKNFKNYEPVETNFLLLNIQPGQRVLNIGAHVGIFTTLISRIVGLNGKVVALEPQKFNYKLLKHNLKRNGLKNWESHKLAAGNRDSQELLFFNKKNTGDNRMFDPSISETGGSLKYQGFTKRKVQKVTMVKIDSLFKTENFEFILIDAQGFDHDVLLGAQELIKRSMPLILLEFVPGWLEARGIDPSATLKFYRSLGYNYKILEFNSENNPSFEKINTIMKSTNLFFVNIILFTASPKFLS